MNWNQWKNGWAMLAWSRCERRKINAMVYAMQATTHTLVPIIEAIRPSGLPTLPEGQHWEMRGPPENLNFGFGSARIDTAQLYNVGTVRITGFQGITDIGDKKDEEPDPIERARKIAFMGME